MRALPDVSPEQLAQELLPRHRRVLPILGEQTGAGERGRAALGLDPSTSLWAGSRGRPSHTSRIG